MAFLGLGAAAADSAVGMAANAVGSIVAHYFPDPQKAAEFQLEMYKTLQSSDLSQLDVNKIEAANGNVFVSGWRPAIGWVGAAAIAWQFLLRPIALAFSGLIDPKFTTIMLNVPGIDDNLWQLITAMLGLGAMRSYDKMKIVTGK